MAVFLGYLITGANSIAEQDPDGTGFTNNTSSPRVTSHNLAGTRNDVGLYFPNIAIPPGSTILHASLWLDLTTSDDPYLNIKLEDIDDAPSFVDNADLVGRTRTTASVHWNQINLGGGVVNSPDFSAALQEVIDRAGWAYGNAIVVYLESRADISNRIISFDDDTPATQAPDLAISYIPPDSDEEIEIAFGSYVGDGNEEVVDVGFAPDGVLVDGEDAPVNPWEKFTFIKTRTLSGLTVHDMVGTGSGDGFSITDTGFTALAANAQTVNGNQYHWFAWKNGSRAQTGQYVGNSADNRQHDVGFEPDLVIIYRIDGPVVFRVTGHSAGESQLFSGNPITDRIQSFYSTGFEIGTHADVNGDGFVYHFAAFKVGEKFSVLQYVGNGVDNRNITGYGLTPVIASTHRVDGAAASYVRFDTMAPGESTVWDNTPESDGIQDLIPDGIQVGTKSQVNNNGSTFNSWAFGNPVPVIDSVTPDTFEEGDNVVIAGSNFGA